MQVPRLTVHRRTRKLGKHESLHPLLVLKQVLAEPLAQKLTSHRARFPLQRRKRPTQNRPHARQELHKRRLTLQRCRIRKSREDPRRQSPPIRRSLRNGTGYGRQSLRFGGSSPIRPVACGWQVRPDRGLLASSTRTRAAMTVGQRPRWSGPMVATLACPRPPSDGRAPLFLLPPASRSRGLLTSRDVLRNLLPELRTLGKSAAEGGHEGVIALAGLGTGCRLRRLRQRRIGR